MPLCIIVAEFGPSFGRVVRYGDHWRLVTRIAGNSIHTDSSGRLFEPRRCSVQGHTLPLVPRVMSPNG